MITVATVLTPVCPGREDELAATLATLAAESHLLTATHRVHFARWVIIGSVHGSFPRLPARKRQLRMKYLLMTAAVDDSFESFVEALWTTAGRLADKVWSPCVGYPGRADPVAFRAYFTHNRLKVSNSYIAYHNTVPDLLDAFDVKKRHLRLALSLRGSGIDPLKAFRSEFP